MKTAGGEFSAPLTELHDAWWNSIARAMARLKPALSPSFFVKFVVEVVKLRMMN